jgi:hypothetical protein
VSAPEPAEGGHRRRRAWQLIRALDTLGASPAATLALAERMRTDSVWLALVCTKADQMADNDDNPFPRFAVRPPSPATLNMAARMLRTRLRADREANRRPAGPNGAKWMGFPQ